MAFKRQLHVSTITLIGSCAHRYYLRHIRAIHRPRSPALVVGSAAHKGSAMNLTHKVANDGELLPLDEVTEITSKSLNEECDREEGVSKDGIKKITRKEQGELVDESVRFAKIHYDHVAPVVNPGKAKVVVDGEEMEVANVERPYVLNMKNYPFNLAGTIDLVDEDEQGVCVRDSKTARRSPAPFKAQSSIQGTAYTMALHYMDKIPYPIGFGLDYLVKLKDPKNDKHVHQRSERHLEGEKVFLRIFEMACKVIDNQCWMPAEPGGFSSPCNYCEYRHGDCVYYRDPTTVAF